MPSLFTLERCENTADSFGARFELIEQSGFESPGIDSNDEIDSSCVMK